MILGSVGLAPLPPEEGAVGVDAETGLPRRVRLRLWSYPLTWAPGPRVYLGSRPVRVHEFVRWRADADHPWPRDLEAQSQHPDRPVVQVSWERAVIFAAGVGARLPRRSERSGVPEAAVADWCLDAPPGATGLLRLAAGGPRGDGEPAEGDGLDQRRGAADVGIRLVVEVPGVRP
jgi:hypothetical protein